MFSKTTLNSNLFQNKLKLMSLSKVWNENERFKLVFTKLLVFTAKTGARIYIQVVFTFKTS
jgi:hypothetical protein